MRTQLSKLITDAARKDPKVVILTSDHGYCLFDEIKKECPNQFINCGIMEQSMIGIAAGLAKDGFKPIVYGLASFVPMRCLEQIKLDICHSNLQIVLLGDGAGLVYSTLGASHHCAEDLGALRPMPNLSIYQPADMMDLQICFGDALNANGPSYIRIGKSELGRVGLPFIGEDRTICLISTGSMSKKVNELAHLHEISSINVTEIKPLCRDLIDYLFEFENVIVFEEHAQAGGLYSAIAEEVVSQKGTRPRVIPICLKDKFADKCGSWQYALSEHQMDNESLEERLKEIMENA